jgi:hypothetical protein
MFADWADFDMVTAHFGYCYDLLCTQDQGKARTNSIFGSQYASDLADKFQVTLIAVGDLAAKCWAEVGLPLRKW